MWTFTQKVPDAELCVNTVPQICPMLFKSVLLLVETSLRALEPKLHLAGWAIAMLGEFQVDPLAVRCYGLTIFVITGDSLPPEEDDDVGILLDAARVPQI